MKKSKIIVFNIVIFFVILIYANTSYANYQSYTSTETKEQLLTWIKGIRAMESYNQVMGLSETYDSNTLKATSESNNIDVHMLKNTEYGAVALLSASQQYGKKGEGSTRYIYNGSGLKTTTGNAYGVYFSGNWENTATFNKEYESNISSKYVDRYYGRNTKEGDAMLYWHNKYRADFIGSHNGYCRGNYGIFSFDYWGGTSSWLGRAAIMCGKGF